MRRRGTALVYTAVAGIDSGGTGGEALYANSNLLGGISLGSIGKSVSLTSPGPDLNATFNLRLKSSSKLWHSLGLSCAPDLLIRTLTI